MQSFVIASLTLQVDFVHYALLSNYRHAANLYYNDKRLTKDGGTDSMKNGTVDMSVTTSFEIIRRICGDKWKFLTICYLFNGPRRFGELLYHLDSITQKVLSENLRELESLGLIERICYQEVPKHVEYRLTETGKSLQPIFHNLIIWGLNYAQGQKYEKRANSD